MPESSDAGPQTSEDVSNRTTGKGHLQLADVLSETSLRYIASAAAVLGKLAAFLSALLMSGPCWLLISLCGPHMPHLFVPVLIAAALRLLLVACNLVQQALDDGVLELWETCGIITRFLCDALVTANAVFPQPIFTTIVGGSFSSGDAARAAHMRASRWLWRTTVSISAEYILLPAMSFFFLYQRYKSYKKSMVPTWVRDLVASFCIGVCWTVLAARMQMLPIGFLLGLDPSHVLASVCRSHCCASVLIGRRGELQPTCLSVL